MLLDKLRQLNYLLNHDNTDLWVCTQKYRWSRGCISALSH